MICDVEIGLDGAGRLMMMSKRGENYSMVIASSSERAGPDQVVGSSQIGFTPDSTVCLPCATWNGWHVGKRPDELEARDLGSQGTVVQ